MLSDSRRGRFKVCVQDRNLRFALERHPTRQALVEQTTERIDVGPRVEPLAADLLRRHVVDRSQWTLGWRQRRVEALAEPEVPQPDVRRGRGGAAAIDQHVAGLDISVDQADRVCGVERAGELLDDPDRDWGGEPALGADQRLQVAAGDVAHRDVVDAVDLARVVDREDVRMVEARGERRLLHKAFADRVVGGQIGGQYLQRDIAREADLGRVIDSSGPAAPDRGMQPVTGPLHRRLHIRSPLHMKNSRTQGTVWLWDGVNAQSYD